MPVTKRLRYEILRRDNHTCRYCGATAPDVKMTIDHVVPIALGGPDDPANLVAACEPCNSGKTSVPANAPIVADVAADALRWSAAMARAAEVALEDFEARQEYRDLFRQAWDQWGVGEGDSRMSVPLDDNWKSSLDNLRAAGLPDWELEEAVRAAMTAQKVKPSDTWRYFCGIAWTKIRKMQENARALLEPVKAELDLQDEHQRLSEGAETVALHAWLSAWRQQHGSWPDGDEEAQFGQAMGDGFVRESLRGKGWMQIYSVITAAHAAGIAGVTQPELVAPTTA